MKFKFLSAFFCMQLLLGNYFCVAEDFDKKITGIEEYFSEASTSIYKEVIDKWFQNTIKMGFSKDSVIENFQEKIQKKSLARYYFSLLSFYNNFLDSTFENSKNFYTDGLEYNLDRLVLHDEIISYLVNHVKNNATKTPQLLILMGGAASGKTHIKDSLIYKKTNLSASISSDQIRELIPEYLIGKERKIQKISSMVHEECLDINRKALQVLFDQKLSFIYESTGADISYSKWLISNAKERDYQVGVALVDTDVETAIERALKREEITGRFVPISVIEKSNAMAKQNFGQLLSFVDEWLLIDNNFIPTIVWEKRVDHIPICSNYRRVSSILEKNNEVYHLENNIRQIENIESIYPFIDENTLVVFDIDDTLITAEEASGRDSGRSYISKKIREMQQVDQNQSTVLSNCLSLLMDSIHVKPVEDQTVFLFNQLLDQNILVLGLTSRSMSGKGIANLGKKTFEHLEKCHIFFPANIFTDIEIFKLPNSASLYKGVIFSGTFEKGESLIAFLESFDLTTKKIIFIDNKIRHAESVISSCKNKGITVESFYYTRAAEKNVEISKKIALFQLKFLANEGILLSDEEAKSYLGL